MTSNSQDKLSGNLPADADLSREDAIALVHELRSREAYLQEQIKAENDGRPSQASHKQSGSPQQNDLCHAVFEQAPVPFAIANLAGELSYNAAFAEHLQLSPEPSDRESINIFKMESPWRCFDTNGNPVDNNSLLVRALEGETTNDLEVRIVGQNGDERWKLISAAPIYNNENELVAGFITHTDITDLKHAEELLRGSERESRAWLESSPVCTKKIDTDFNLQYMSTAGIEALGFEDVTEYYGKPYPFDFFPESFRQKMIEKMEYVRDTGKVTEMESAINTLSGNKLWFHSTLVPVFDKHGEIDYTLIVSIESTKRKQAEESLRESNAQLKEQTKLAIEMAQKAEAANISKSEFLANMSHEIRTPMTAILGFSETIAESVKNPENIQAIETVRRNGDYLLTIINDILDLSKIEAGKFEIEHTQHCPCSVVAEVAALMESRAFAKGLGFKVEFQGEIPETIKTDPTRLQQILLNLVGNAIKFTQEGAIKLTGRHVQEGDASYMQFDVLDTGIGMTQEQIAGLFKPFTQADGSTTRRFGGTGLGLTISKRFAEMLGGTITITDSKLGSGTRFRVTVETGSLEGVGFIKNPNLPKAKPTVNTAMADLTGIRVLYAEDGRDNQKLISFFLEKAGASIEVVENGKLALEAALKAKHLGRAFDCILMDMQMPVMGGYQATTALRDACYAGPIIALTAHAMDGDREKCLAAGCTDFTNKPINRSDLINMIASYSQRATKAA